MIAQSVEVGAQVRIDSEGTFSTNLASVSLSQAPFVCKTLTTLLL